MGLASFFVKTFIGRATAVGIGAMIKATKRNKQRRLQEQAEEERRKNTPCHFVDGISENAFSRIVKRSSKRFRRLKVTRIDGAVIYLEYYSQSGLSSYNAVIDFNDYGHITGRYWLENENEDSNLPTAFADYLSKQLIENKSFVYRRVKPAPTPVESLRNSAIYCGVLNKYSKYFMMMKM